MLRVAYVFQETQDVKTYRFVDPGGGRIPFDFLPGQFLWLTLPESDGRSLKRSYTIASSPAHRDYVEITVKREERGIVSRRLHDELKVSDSLQISAPHGKFTFWLHKAGCL
jgi:ferredoxin-NADP reductase